MSITERIAELQARFGAPGLTNFGFHDLAGNSQLGIGVFALALQDGAAVLIRRKPIEKYPGIENYWWIPGGENEHGEPLEQTAVRELREETGLEVELDRLLLSYLSHEHPWLCFFFQAHVVAGSVSAGADPDNITAEARAFHPGELALDSLWMDTDKILLARAGFVDAPVDALLEKYHFRAEQGDD